jgi:beta-galactosidase
MTLPASNASTSNVSPVRSLPSRLLYGGDYNPEQWHETPEVWDEDMRLMREAGVNTVSLGIFSWVTIEPEEGVYHWDWLDSMMDKLHANQVGVNLATPSGAKPSWMAQKYPEIRRVSENGIRDKQRGRHNHCPTSPVYRAKVHEMNTRLAERYGKHPALQLWHISNEYGGYCYCDLCLGAFQQWLRVRYNDDLNALNRAWWTRFWSHTYTDWSQIDAIDSDVHGLQLDWRRFMTDQVTGFLQNELEPIRRITPDVPATTNFMGTYDAYNYWKLAEPLDVVCWDAYPGWHGAGSEAEVACNLGFTHDIYRSMKAGRPWLLMETTPSLVNWQPVSRPRRPGMNRLSNLQAVAHGSDAVLYFQWRKGRGSGEKFHGAVVDHNGANNRVFRECAALGAELKTLSSLAGATTPAEVALVYDWENEWAIKFSQGPRNKDKNYGETVRDHYRPFWKRGVSVDVVDSTVDFSPYKLLVAPMLYMMRPGVAERITDFVQNGGAFVATYLTGIASESDLVFLGGFPGPLKEVLGVWVEETDVLHDHQTQTVQASEAGQGEGLMGEYAARHLCDIVHAKSADILATYGQDFYAHTPAITRNTFGKGSAYYIAARCESRLADDLLGNLVQTLNLSRALPTDLPDGVNVQRRFTDRGQEVLFVLNFTEQEQTVQIPAGLTDVSTSEPVRETLTLAPYGAHVLA